METTIEKNITLKIKINGAKYCSNNCRLAYKNTCLLSNYMGFPDKTVFRYKDMDKNMFYRTDDCIKLCKSRNHKKNNYSFFYSLPISVFYETAYSSNSIKDAAKKLGTSESNLKWFLYSVDSIYKDKEKIKLRIDRVCAFFDGQNEARKDKIRK